MHKSQSKQETHVISFYIFTLPFFVFSKECLYEMKENLLNLCHTRNDRVKMIKIMQDSYKL